MSEIALAFRRYGVEDNVDVREFSWVLFIPAMALWCAALFQPALKQPGTGTFHYSGLNCLLLGWLGLFGIPKYAAPWLANVLFWMSLASGLFRRHTGRQALVLSLVAIPLALVALAIRTIEVDEAGNRTAVVPGFGFYLWLASMLALAAAQVVRTETRL
ncbi:MAG: hypothetical protein LAP38_19945 [Acidobacteriia bacterium]|nr:hypothetical protein [Terriglobia bacterium]